MKTSGHDPQTSVSPLVRLLWPLAVSLIMIFTLTLRFRSVEAATAAAVGYVAPGGSCGSVSPCYGSIQAAVDAASDGDEIRVAAGTYTGAQTKVSATTSYTYTQVVMVDGKNLTLKGGFTTSNWNIADPLVNPTIIDAQNYGRGLTLIGSGTQTVTVSGFQIINGDYTNLGNPTGVGNAACPTTSGDCAGGLLAYNVKLILRDTLIRNNTASRIRPYSHAGGILLWATQNGSLIENTQIFSNTNTTDGYGGGVEAHYTYGSLTIRNVQFDNNHSTYDGGGLLLTSVSGPVVIENSRFVGNSAVGVTDAQGGGMSASMSEDLLLDRVEFRDNRASNDGAALSVRKVGTGAPKLSLVNVLAAGNQLQSAQPYGGAINIVDGIEFQGFNIHIQQTTVAANQTPSAIRISQWDTRSTALTATITNTLITSATYGVVGNIYTSTLVVTQTNSLFFNVANQTAAENGAPTFNTTGTVTGDPKLDANQRLQAGSAAIDAGVNSGVTLDLDGGVRPGGSGYDIGADEYSASAPGSFRFSQATYATPEGNGVTITVERINGTAGSVTVHYATSDGTATAGNDYTAASGTLTFADGVTSQTFNVATIQDTAVEADETIVLALSNPGGGATLGSPYQSVITIQDDDVAPAGKLQFSQADYTVLENGGTAVITVQRVNGSSGAVTVDYATSSGTATPGSDYQDTSGTLNFTDGETSKTFTVTILNDSVNDPDETVILALTNATGGATLGAPNQATLTIVQSGYKVFLPMVIR
ncbi:MAG: Calx-beta domain-containing protein [Anaerolineae bacterium]